MICPNCKKEIEDTKKICPNCKYVFISEETKRKVMILIKGIGSFILAVCTFLLYFDNINQKTSYIYFILGIIFLVESFINFFSKNKIIDDKLIFIYNILPNLLFISLLVPMIVASVINKVWIVAGIFIALILLPIINLIKKF